MSIALIGLPNVAAALRDLGLDVIDGGFTDVSVEIRAALDANRSIDGLLVVDIHQKGAPSWLAKVSDRITVRVVHGIGGAFDDFEGVTLPVSINDALASLNMSPVAGGERRMLADPNGYVTVEPAAPAPVAYVLPEIPAFEPEDAYAQDYPVEPPPPIDPYAAPAPPPITPPTFAPPAQESDPAPAAPPPPPLTPPRTAAPVEQAPSFNALLPATIEHPYEPEPEPEHDHQRRVTKPNRRRGLKRAPILFVLAGKGGVGKTTTTLALADFAGRAGLRVVVVEMNRGQDDAVKYLRVSKVPTAYDAAIIGPERWSQYVVTADALNDMRSARVARAPLHFSIVFAPRPEHADPDVVTAATYAAIIDEAAYEADLVIVDTQTMEAFDTSGLFDNVVTRELTSGAWAVGVTDPSVPAVGQLKQRIEQLKAYGVSADRIMVLFNRQIDGEAGYTQDRATSLFNDSGARMIGSVRADDQVIQLTNMGGVASQVDSMVPALCEALYRATGLATFNPQHIVRVAGKQAKRPTKSDKKRTLSNLFGLLGR